MFKIFSTVVLTAAIAAAQCTVGVNATTGRLDCQSVPTAGSMSGTRNMVTEFGTPNNGAVDANKFIVSALYNGPSTYLFPAGDYRINNDGGPLVIPNFNGKMLFDPGARFICTNANKMCVQFSFGSPKIEGITLKYVTPAVSRTDNAVGLFFYQGNDHQLVRATVSGSGGPAIQFQESIRPLAMNIRINNVMADGLDFFNCQNAVAADLQTESTGDDGLAFVNYGMYQNYNGGNASNIRVNNSNARGITIVGASNVSVTGFVVSNTTNAGVMCITDTYYGTRTGTNASFTNGVIVGAGSYRPSWTNRPNGINGNPFGIEWQMPANQGSCSFENISLTNVLGNASFGGGNAPRGIAGAGGQEVTLRNVVVDGVAGDGVNGGSAKLTVDNVTVKNASGYAFFLNGYSQPSGSPSNIIGNNLTAINSGFGLSGGVAGRAMGFERNASLNLSNLKVVDTQGVPTGYKVEEWNNTAGSVAGIDSTITNGALAVETSSNNVRVTRWNTVIVQPNDPGCRTALDSGKIWMDPSSNQYRLCSATNNSLSWKVVQR